MNDKDTFRRILQIGMTANKGGIESYLMTQYRHINREKIRYDFLNITSEKQIAFADEILSNDDKIYSVPARHISPIKHYFYMILLFVKIRKKYHGVILNACSLDYVFPLLLAWIVRIPMRVIHSHNSGNEKKQSVARCMLRRFNTIILSFVATSYWACSKMAGDWMFNSKDYSIIHNAIEIDKFLYNPIVRKSVRQELFLEDKFVVGNVARFSYQKNHDFLIEVFKKLHEKEKNAILLLIGQAPDDETNTLIEVKDKINRYGLQDSVLFLGIRDDTNELYQAMDCLILPSRFEGLSVTAIEAQASGVVCFFSDRLTEETNITPVYHTLSLEESPSKWADDILSYKGSEHENMKEYIVHAGYDIVEETKKIEHLFEMDEF